MIQKMRSWLIRHRDQTAVSYNRFGRPGEEEEDKPPPTAILVAPFNENAAEFVLFNVCHVQKAAVYFACFGMSMVVMSFVSTFFEFEWYHHTRGVDVTTLLGLFFYLGLGLFIHYSVIHGVRKGRARFLLPFIALYSVICSFELFICAVFFFKIIDPNATIASAHGIPVKHPPFAWMLIGMLFVLTIQALMLLTVLRCRYFLSQRELHAMALQVAEKSRQDYPSIQIVVTSGTVSSAAAATTTASLHGTTDAIGSGNDGDGTVVPNGNGRDATIAVTSAQNDQQQQQNGSVGHQHGGGGEQQDQPILKV